MPPGNVLIIHRGPVAHDSGHNAGGFGFPQAVSPDASLHLALGLYTLDEEAC
jgi:hypothetical protein